MTQIYVKGGLAASAPCDSSHGTPEAFTHVRAVGAAGRQLYAACEAVAVKFARYHPTLTWAALPTEYKRASGWPIQLWAGDSNPADDTPLTQEEFDVLGTIDFYVAGHMIKCVSMTSTSGNPFVILECPDGNALETSFQAADVIWKTGDDFDAVAAEYKDACGGSPLDLTGYPEQTVLKE